ncbi:Hypothetical protein CINCED_3A006490 [Cinara cedri]|uniref:Uncharacterized protein n=1 Tax=Cinara cedri TaxID=506608 RepID=A0A5E4NJF5_9HEMI|nr:Hypothetical protein CINCED_3A006490 [Cinara cedri]
MTDNNKFLLDTNEAADIVQQFVKLNYPILNKTPEVAFLYNINDQLQVTLLITRNFNESAIIPAPIIRKKIYISTEITTDHQPTLNTSTDLETFPDTTENNLPRQTFESIKYPADIATNHSPTVNLRKKMYVSDKIGTYYRTSLNASTELKTRSNTIKDDAWNQIVEQPYVPVDNHQCSINTPVTLKTLSATTKNNNMMKQIHERENFPADFVMYDHPLNTSTIMQPLSGTTEKNLTTPILDSQTLPISTEYNNTSQIPIPVPLNAKNKMSSKFISASYIRPSTIKNYPPSKIPIRKFPPGFIQAYHRPALNTFTVFQPLPKTIENNLTTSISNLQNLPITIKHNGCKYIDKNPIRLPLNTKIRTSNKPLPETSAKYICSSTTTKKPPSRILNHKSSPGFIPAKHQPALNTSAVLQPLSDTTEKNLATPILDLQTLPISTEYKNTSQIPIRVPLNAKNKMSSKIISTSYIRPSTIKNHPPSKIPIRKFPPGFTPT